MVKDDDTGNIDWKSQDDHPMVKDDTKSTDTGSIDWKSQDDHPIVRDDEKKDEGGSIDWHSQDDHPMVKDDDKKKDDNGVRLIDLWNDMFNSDGASPLSVGASLIAASLLAAQI